MIFGIGRGTGDGPVALGNRADVADILQTGIVLALSSTGVAGGNVVPVLIEVASLLGVGPGLALEIGCQSFEIGF